jgi:hypothetical protein
VRVSLADAPSERSFFESRGKNARKILQEISNRQKQCGKINERGCADGRKQRETTSKEEASSPTVAIESVMLSTTIDAMEERDVATVDIPGAFMQANIDEVVRVRFEIEIAKMLVRMDPKLYRKYVRYENGKAVPYVELLKALY